jgi:glycosyltransferase involved in cell wall biosynthesis
MPLGSKAAQREFALQKSVKGPSPLPPYIENAAVNIVHMNGDTLPIMLLNGGEELFRNKYNIAVWYWELPTLRPEWQASMKYFHEFWAPTPFIERTLKHSTAKPVRLIPPYLSYLTNMKSSKNTADDVVNFVYCFDANSILERKNPSALVAAFWKAFPQELNNVSVRLTFKITYPNRNITEVNQLYEAAKIDSRIKIIDRLLSDAELHSLIGSASAYVSPHRSEGLGLTIIEAMGAGVPVIATPFGGVETFVTPDAAFPIAFRYSELRGDYVPYPKGFVWADPDIESLAEQLYFVQQNPDEAKRRANVARQRVIDFFCSPSLIHSYSIELQRISHHG